jgi:hypothetical protein
LMGTEREVSPSLLSSNDEMPSATFSKRHLLCS